MGETRRKIIAGNWKMNGTVDEAVGLADGLKLIIAELNSLDVVVCPPFTALFPVTGALEGSGIETGAQNLYHEKEGAFTGEVSPVMLRDLGCTYVIIGHSERRTLFGETDGSVQLKVRAALDHGLKPILCVGETLDQRDAGNTESIVSTQVKLGLSAVEMHEVPSVVIAYEPVWAIGTGRSATAEEANRVIGLIRQQIVDGYGADAGDTIRVQYGGSVKATNWPELVAQPEIDGALVGGASLDVASFSTIVKASVEA